MKKSIVIFLAAAILLTFAGCGRDTGQPEASQGTGQEVSRESSSAQEAGSEESTALPEQDASGQQEKEPDEIPQLRDDYEDNFHVSEQEAAEFGKMIKEAVAGKDVEKLADLTGFPVYVGLSGGIVAETREDFTALDVGELFSEEMVTSMAEADENSLSPSMAGFTLCGSDGGPSITFGVRDGSLAISGINYGF